jgi:hypothetical protein
MVSPVVLKLSDFLPMTRTGHQLTTSRDHSFMGNPSSEPPCNDPRTLIDEIACAIADAQAALFAGRFRDLDRCTLRQQELCAVLKTYARGEATPVPPFSSPD